MTEANARLIDSLCKIAATLGLVVGGVWTVVTYFDHQDEVTRAAEIEAKKPFASKRQELYFQAVQLAGRAVSTSDRDELLKAEVDFLELAQGPLLMVQDEEVGEEMALFKDCISNKTGDLCKDAFDRFLAMAAACRGSLATTWDVSLPPQAITKKMLERLRR